MKPFENELGREGIGYGRFGWQKRRCRDGGNGKDGRVPALCPITAAALLRLKRL